MKKDQLAELDAATLFRLAREKERAERMAEADQRRELLRELRDRRRQMLERHRRELAEVDRELAGLQPGATRRPRVTDGRSRRRRAEGPSIGGRLCAIIAEKPEMSIEEIRERATADGISLKTITQMLAYLKRTGRLTSLRRGSYSVVPGHEMP